MSIFIRDTYLFPARFTEEDLIQLEQDHLADILGRSEPKNQCPYCESKVSPFMWISHQVVYHLMKGHLDTSEAQWWRQNSNCARNGIVPPELQPWDGFYITSFQDTNIEIKLTEKK